MVKISTVKTVDEDLSPFYIEMQDSHVNSEGNPSGDELTNAVETGNAFC
jgi:hypothetical protein